MPHLVSPEDLSACLAYLAAGYKVLFDFSQREELYTRLHRPMFIIKNDVELDSCEADALGLCVTEEDIR